MDNNKIDIDKIKEQIKKLKIEILEKEEELDKLLDILDDETNDSE